MNSVAIILTGELRFESEMHYNMFKKLIHGYPLFIATYQDYQSVVDDFQPVGQVITSRREVHLKHSCMYQWYHLDQIIQNYQEQLQQYDYLIKIRTDMYIGALNQIKWEELEDNTMYTYFDRLFYAKSDHFIKVFQDFYSTMLSKYEYKDHLYHPINYLNLAKSDCSETMYLWLVLPKLVHYRDFTQLRLNIVQNYDELQETNWTENDITTYKPFIDHLNSDKMHLINMLDHGLVKPGIKMPLMSGRQKWEDPNSNFYWKSWCIKYSDIHIKQYN